MRKDYAEAELAAYVNKDVIPVLNRQLRGGQSPNRDISINTATVIVTSFSL